ncbi:VOC family protein [Streptomonospora sp. S1-112]|uniref:VOC family protein n=1 Tax=Streptomonospora mangrovi TaxID=2883123 RepID=A0A9X3NHB8_9ACTN|nr:VOC family protein [Streptomonospora mangrovi]MDA0563123.1 VOC family protein [Streptomonospora mangrovi]
MTIQRMDHVSVVVGDLPAAVAFFTALGMELEGQAPAEGPEVDRLVGIDGVRADIAMMRTPDGHGGVELTRYHAPPATAPEQAAAPVTAPGLRTVMFAVDDLDDTLARLLDHGVRPVGDVVRYGDAYRLVYVRGPENVLVALAEPIS